MALGDLATILEETVEVSAPIYQVRAEWLEEGQSLLGCSAPESYPWFVHTVLSLEMHHLKGTI